MSEISINTLKTMLANLDDAKKYQVPTDRHSGLTSWMVRRFLSLMLWGRW